MTTASELVPKHPLIVSITMKGPIQKDGGVLFVSEAVFTTGERGANDCFISQQMYESRGAEQAAAIARRNLQSYWDNVQRYHPEIFLEKSA